MPPRMYLDPLPEGNAKGKVVTMQDFDRMLTEYYHLWGWDDQGKPMAATIQELGLAELPS
jgi:aldehyde:ferredoxin oxidoreductase